MGAGPVSAERIYVVEFKTPTPCLHWVRLGQFAIEQNAVDFAEECRRNSKRDRRHSSYRVVPSKLMDPQILPKP